jgi:4-oxalomesaconate hydratase
MKKERILAVSAHAADFCSRSGGTLIKYAKAGHEVHVLDLTVGERGESEDFWKGNAGASYEQCREQRKSEVRAAADIIGAHVEFMGYSDYPLEMDGKRIEALAMYIQDMRPNIILTHYPNDPFNVDHAVTGNAVIRAVSIAATPGLRHGRGSLPIPSIFFFESSVPQTEFNKFEIDTYMDITDVFEQKMQACAKLVSQLKLTGSYSAYAERRGWQCTHWIKRQIKYAEAFKRYVPYIGEWLPVSDYMSGTR